MGWVFLKPIQMNTKKNRDYDLERLRTPLTFLGLLFASAVALAMLEWRVPDEAPVTKGYDPPIILTDEVVFAAIPEKPKVPAPQPKNQKVIDAIILIEDGIEDGTKDPILDFPTLDDPDVIDIPKVPEVVFEPEVIIPDVMPEFPGGEGAMRAYLRDELKYPSMARNINIQGTVWIEFLVNKKGEISEVKLLRGVGGGCDEEALRVVLQMPRWTPGKQHGHAVNVRYQLPISFVLRN